MPTKRLTKILEALLDEREFFGPAGIRSLSKIHRDPYVLRMNEKTFMLQYEPAESTTGLYGGNSNWRGPVWLPMNYLLIQALKTYCHHYQQGIKVNCPTQSARMVDLKEVANDIAKRLIGIFTQDEKGERKVRQHEHYRTKKDFMELLLYYEYFDGDIAGGLGASHQTGWTALVADLIQTFAV